MKNNIKNILLDLKICAKGSVYKYYGRTRDRDDVAVWRCKNSGVIFLSTSKHLNDDDYYHKQKAFGYWTVENRSEAVRRTLTDDQRRAKQFKRLITGKRWLDFGTGNGGILDLLKNQAKETMAVEPQDEVRQALDKIGYRVYQNLKSLTEKDFDAITLFHVLEHLLEPVETLKVLRQKLAPGGKIIIEVPHAKDILLTTYNLESFKKFTFWSEHLILHTRDSLNRFLKAAGYKKISINGYQRYPLANHLYWLAQGKPGGQQIWPQLRDPKIDADYEKLLNEIDQTDTLIAVAEK